MNLEGHEFTHNIQEGSYPKPAELSSQQIDPEEHSIYQECTFRVVGESIPDAKILRHCGKENLECFISNSMDFKCRHHCDQILASSLTACVIFMAPSLPYNSLFDYKMEKIRRLFKGAYAKFLEHNKHSETC